MLTEKAISQAKPKDKIYRLHDRDGLYLEISPKGGKWWRLKYRLNGKENRKSLGTYPLVSLKEAREKTFEYRKQILGGNKPGATDGPSDSDKFELFARDWWDKFKKPKLRRPEEIIKRLEREVFPFIGSKPLSEIGPHDLLKVLQRIEQRPAIEIAYKVYAHINEILRYAVVIKEIESNPARDLTGALGPKRKKPMAAVIDPKKAGKLLADINGYTGTPVVSYALKLAPLTFVRPGELRKAKWEDISLDDAEWRLPDYSMKMGKPHIVPLSRQAVDILRKVNEMTGHGQYVFPSLRTLSRPMSENTINAALRSLGYSQDEMTGHGFRAMAMSLLAELGWSVEVIDRQLAHTQKNQVRAAYHRSEYLKERRKMMQVWADYLDSLKASA